MTAEDEAMFEEIRAELERFVAVIRDRVGNDESTVWRLNEIAFARRRDAHEEERSLLTTLLVVLADVSRSMRVD